MAASLRKTPAPPLGVIESIASGFETVNGRLELILLPLALDLFLWFGPHLSVKPVVDQSLGLMRLPPGTDPATAQSFETWRHVLSSYGSTFNLFSVLSTLAPLNTVLLWLLGLLGLVGPLRMARWQSSLVTAAPLGLPSLVAGRAPLVVPGGQPIFLFVDNPLEYLLLFGAFVLVGLFLGALYLGGIAQQVRDAHVDVRRLFRQVWGDWARLTALAAMAAAFLFFGGMPVLLFASLVALVSTLAAAFVLILGLMAAFWILFYAGFALHDIILQRRGLFGALWDSLRLVQRNLPPTAGLYVALVVLSLGLGELWNIPSDDSWLLLIGVVGHALVSTALVAATFAFYKDRYRWWVEMRQTRQAQAEAERGGANRSTKA